MKNIVNTYVERFRADHQKARRMTSLLLALALLVACGVFWQLHYTGIALTNETYCGLEEHTHTEDCYEEVLTCTLEESEGHTHTEDCYETVTTLVCALEESEGHTHTEDCYDEEGNLTCELEESEGHTHTEDCYETEEVLVCALEESEGHTHTEDCYETVLTCTLEEHTHTITCMSDETADVETADDWEATLPELTGLWAEDVAAVAESQLGYTESTANFILDEDGETRRGYTRYGAWAGNEYGDWDAMFASFCLYYGGVSTEDFPESTGAYAWAVKLDECGLYAEAADCAPAPGDLVFFDTDGDDTADAVGIVTGVDDDGGLTVIEGDCATDDGADAVAENTYAADDGTILGYGVLPEQEAGEETAEEDDAAEEEPDEGDADEEGTDEEGADEEGSDEEGADEEGSDEEGSDEEGSDEEGTDEEGSDEEGTDEEGTDEEGADEEGADEEGADEGDADEEGSDEEGSDEEGSDEEGSDEEGSDEEGSDEGDADEEGSDEEGSDEGDADEEGSDEEGADEEGADEEGTDEEGADEEGADEEGADEEGADEEGADEEGADEEGSDEEGSDEEGSDEEGSDEVETETYTASADSVTVTVTAPAGALPEGAELTVALLDEDSDAYANAAEAIGYDGEDEDSGMAALDIAFHDGDGLEVEPSGAVTVSIDASALLPEDADAGTIEVQHLAETEDGVETVLVADASEDTEGTVDTETATIEFEVESFSTFTVTWNGNVTLNVTVYVDGEDYTGSVGNVTLSSGSSIDLTTLLSSDDYTFSYATVVYGYSGNNSGSVDTATAITYTTSGRNGTYTITTVGSTITNVNRINSVAVYYVSNTKGPSVSISAEETTTGYDLTATPSNFSGTDVTYTWTVDDTASASISESGEDATLTWAEGISNGTEVNVTVTATYTYEDGDGNTVTETATDTYTVYYGVAEDVTFTVYYPTSSGTSAAASGVTVYVYDSNGTLVGSGTTNSSGQVTFELYDGVTYTVTTSDYTANSYTYSYSGSVTADATNGNVISLVRDTSSGKYDHIDIKYVGMSSNGSDLELDSITSVVVYDSSGNVVYTTSSITENSTENNWQCFFNGSHSISFDTSYTVGITFVADGETYYATIDSTTTYPEGSYYPADGARAWQLYNYIYGTSYTESNWTSSSAYASVKDTGIDVSGMTYFEVAIVLCDSWGESRNGLDFALDIGSLLYLTAGWAPEVQKTYVNGSMASGDFTFNLYEADITEDGTTWTLNDALGSPVESVTNGAAAADASGDSQSTVSFSEINYSTSDAGTYYYIISETQGDDGFVTYDGTIYGVKVVVAVTPVTTSLGVVTSYETTIT